MMSFFRLRYPECPAKYFTLLSGLIYFIPLGSIAVTSTASPYYMSFIQMKTGSSFARYPNTIYLLTLQLTANAIGALLFGILMYKYEFPLKRIAFVGPLILSSSFLLSYFSIQYSFILFCLTFGLLFGLGAGFSFIIPFSITTKWFPKNKGMVSSFVFIGSGIGSTIYPEFSTYYSNPENLSPDKPYSNKFPDEKYFTDEVLLSRVPNSFLIMGLMSIGIFAVALLTMFDKKEESILVSQDSKIVNEVTEELKNDDESKPVLTLSQALRKKNLYLLIIMNSFTLISMNVFGVNYKNYGQTFIEDDQFLTLINSIGSFVNIPVRLLWGIMIDKLPFKITYLIIVSSNMVLLFTVCFNEYFGNKYTYMFYYIIFDLLICGALLIMPQTYVKTFGQKNIFLIHGLVQFFGIPGQFLQSLIAPPLIKDLGYFASFCIINIFSVISWICAALFDAKDTFGNDV